MSTKRLSCVVSVLLLSNAFFSVLATVPVSVNATTSHVDENGLEATEDGVYFTVSQTSIASQIPGIDSSLKENQRSIRGDLKMKAVPVNGLKSARFPDLSGKIGEDDPSPTGTIDPEPMDAPFLPNDVLIYNDIANSEKNVSLAKTSNGTLYAAYDHDIGTGLRDVYVSKSTDGGSTWAKRDIAVDAAEDESCPSIAGDYSPNFGADILYAWYGNPILEFAWSMDGDTWSYVDFGGGITWWDDVRCPYVDVSGDFVVIVAERYDINEGRDTWQILYTLDGTAWTTYYWIMWPGAWVYQPRVSIMDDDEVFVVMDVYDKSDPNPANWFHDTVMAHGTLTNDLSTDSWDSFLYITGIENLALTSPTVEAFGQRVTLAQEVYNPGIAPLSTSSIYCLWTPDFGKVGGANWYQCEDGLAYIAFDPTETKDQKYPSFHQEDGELHFVWLNGTDINYRFSPDGGFEWLTPPMKVNDPSSSTAMDAWHSPGVISGKGRPYIAWHDTRGSDDIYFQTFETNRWYGIRTDQPQPELQVREVGDSWHNSSAYYLWGDGSSHDVEAKNSHVVSGTTRYSFSQWDDGQLVNPATVTVSDSSFNITAQYNLEFWLDMIAAGGTTNPSTGWQQAYAWITISASPPAAPPGGQYLFMGWSGDFTGTDNPCINCVYMDGPKTIIADWLLQWNVTIDTVPTGLTIQVDGIDHVAPYMTWFNDSEMYNVNAASPQSSGPFTRYVWTHWSDAGAQTHNVFATGPEIFIAYFDSEYQITINTNPGGFNIIVDGQTFATPQAFWWNDTSAHTLEALSSIPVGANNRYNFTSWSDFGARIHDIWANTSDETVTANYVFQHKITFQPNNPLITIELDGSPITLPYVFWCDDGSSHTVNAPFQTFGDTRYVFSDWSDGGAQTHIIICVTPLVLQANYDKEYKVYINTTLDSVGSSLDVIAGMVTYPTPAEVWWPADTMMALDTNEFQPGQNPASGIRYKFGDWDDSGIKSRTINVNVPGLIYVANFGTQYKLKFVDPHGVPTTTPGGDPVTDGIYFDMGTSVIIGTDSTVADTADHRWRFDGWSSGDPGGYTGAQIDSVITMNGPITQTVSWIDQYLLTIVTAYGTPSASGWYEQQSPTEYWYDKGDVAFFFVETEVFLTPSLDSKAIFDSWTGAPNGTAMNSGIVVTAMWHMEYLVKVVSNWGTEPTPMWVVEGGTYALTIEDVVIDPVDSDIRYVFDGWTTTDTANGGYQGANRQMTLIVNGPITELALWETQFLLTILSDYGTPVSAYWEEQESSNSFWFVEGSVASFWMDVESHLLPGNRERVTFDGWTGATNGTTMNSPVTVTATWHLEYLVVVESPHGTTPPDAWVRDGQTHQISMDEVVDHPTNEDIRYKFSFWSSIDINVGGYQGTNRVQLLTVAGPIKQTANWIAQYRLRVTSQYEDEPGIIGEPSGEGWYDEGTVVTIEVAGSETKGEWKYRFERWIGSVDDLNDNKTTVTVDEPMSLGVEWSKSKETGPLADMWWILVVIAVIVAVIAVALFMKRGKPAVESLETIEEESPIEETSEETESAESIEEPED